MTDRKVAGNNFAGTTRGAAPASESALMELIATERMDAFESLYRLYHPRLLRFIDGIVGRPAMVEEVLDDTMMVVWRKARSYNRSAKVSTWIFAIAYRQALKALSKVDDAVEFSAELQAEPARFGPEPTVQRQELRMLLDRALAVLSPEHRAVIELTYYFGHSCSEIAEITDCPVDTVKTRMFYARRRLKSLLGVSWEEAL
jgi:RNA polymerase sigma-70 factor (ECF subfamily)